MHQIEFTNATAVGDGSVVAGLKRYRVACGGEHNASESDCHLVSHLARGDSDKVEAAGGGDGGRDELRFGSLRELEESVLPRALLANIVRPMGGGGRKGKGELR